LYAGEIEIGDGKTSSEAEAQFTCEGSQNQPALTDESPEIFMIGSVYAFYTPQENS
jgi:hypothetical protein